MVPVTIPTIKGDEGGYKQIEAWKPPVPYGTIFLLGSNPRTSPMFKGKKPEIGAKTIQLLEEKIEKNIFTILGEIFFI